MKKTPRGTSVGVDDPYELVDRCDHLTDDGRCRFAIERPHRDPSFARDRAESDYQCICIDTEDAAASGDRDFEPEWTRCPHFCCRRHDRACVRCGLEEHLDAHSDERPLLEEHHLSYDTGAETDHEITVYLCRWCHAKTHNSWAALTDDVNPDPEAIAAREDRRSREQSELSFESAAERREDSGTY